MPRGCVVVQGWMTSRLSPCVQYAIDWALFQLEYNGTVDQLYRSYVPIAPCTSAQASAGETGTSTSPCAGILARGWLLVNGRLPAAILPGAVTQVGTRRERIVVVWPGEVQRDPQCTAIRETGVVNGKFNP